MAGSCDVTTKTHTIYEVGNLFEFMGELLCQMMFFFNEYIASCWRYFSFASGCIQIESGHMIHGELKTTMLYFRWHLKKYISKHKGLNSRNTHEILFSVFCWRERHHISYYNSHLLRVTHIFTRFETLKWKFVGIIKLNLGFEAFNALQIF